MELKSSSTLPLEGWCRTQGQFPSHFNTSSRPADHWGCISPVGSVTCTLNTAIPLSSLEDPRVRAPCHPRCSTKSLRTKGKECHGLRGVKSCLRSEGKTVEHLLPVSTGEWFLDAHWYPGSKMLVWHCVYADDSLDTWKHTLVV